jgi:hypothetical protein
VEEERREGTTEEVHSLQLCISSLHGTCLCFHTDRPSTRGGQADFPPVVDEQSNEAGRSVTMADESGIPLDAATSSRLFLSREVDLGCAGKSCSSCLVFASINALCEGTRETRETTEHWHVRAPRGIFCFRTCYMHARSTCLSLSFECKHDFMTVQRLPGLLGLEKVFFSALSSPPNSCASACSLRSSNSVASRLFATTTPAFCSAIICTNLLLVLYIMRCFTFEAVGQVYIYTICVVLPG